MKLLDKLKKKASTFNTNNNNNNNNNAKEDRLVVRYRGSNLRYYDFDISPEAMNPFGFNYADRVETPLGPATVIGVRKGNLWFHVDKDNGASFWNTVKSYSDLKQIGISLLEIEKNGFYKVQKVVYQNKQINVIVQSDDDPFPIIPIVNLLSLRKKIAVPPRATSINTGSIVTQLSSYLIELSVHEPEELAEQITLAVEQLSKGDVNLDFSFLGIDQLPSNNLLALFKVLGIRLVHGWVIDPADEEVRQTIGTRTYSELKKIVDSSNLPVAKLDLIREFLNKTASQLTPYGYSALLNSLQEDELCILYRKNRFSTLMKTGEQLFELSTDDIVYGAIRVGEKLPSFHWEPLRVYPAMRDHTELSNTKVIPPSGPELVKLRSENFDDTFISARFFSTYPTYKSNASSESNPNLFYFSSYSNFTLGVMSQRHPFKHATNNDGVLDTVVEYLEDKKYKIETLRDAGHFLLRSFAEAYQQITNQKGDSTLIAIMSVQLEQKQASDPPYGILCANMGDCKAFLARENEGNGEKEVIDITHGSWISGHWIESGGIKRHRKWNPELCNLRLYFKPCKKDDMVIMTSSGMHENLDPVVMGKIPQPSFHLFPSLTSFKSDHICSLLSDMVSPTSSFSPANCTNNLMRHALKVTHIARYVYLLLGGGSSCKTGHMGFIACVAFTIGSTSSSSLSTPRISEDERFVVNSQGQRIKVESKLSDLSFAMVVNTMAQGEYSDFLDGNTIKSLSNVCSNTRSALLPLMQQRFVFRAIKGRKLKSFSPLNMTTDYLHFIPSSVTHLTFTFNFNQKIDNLLPASILYLTFGHHFNQPIQSLPPSLLHLNFGDLFAQPLPPLPSSLTHLTLGMEFNDSIDNLPPSLISLSLGECFDGPITSLPHSLHNLSITSVKCKIKYLPPNLTHLTCGDYSPSISASSSLTHLTLGEAFDCPSFSLNVPLPPNLTYLSVGDAFNRSFIPPPSLTHLILGGSYNQPFTSFPPHLTHLVLGDSFNHPLPTLPFSLSHLTLGYYFDFPVSIHFIPSSLTKVIVRNRKLLQLRHTHPTTSFVYSLRITL